MKTDPDSPPVTSRRDAEEPLDEAAAEKEIERYLTLRDRAGRLNDEQAQQDASKWLEEVAPKVKKLFGLGYQAEFSRIASSHRRPR